jgi:hypothetical protein
LRRFTTLLLAICALYVASVVVASPLKVRAPGRKSQTLAVTPATGDPVKQSRSVSR